MKLCSFEIYLQKQFVKIDKHVDKRQIKINC